ncbi:MULTISPECIES: DUF4274 domain-containing protein [Flavobacteriaceae]|uniref:DUF4274 domain-containing protein n=1 Tax=Olleya namhaensis TaxID=1144750 RepID=A0A1I3RGR3_9FLAO|nr:DUF4274 domain-containing protein [Olleya namhaensis]SFJ44366.1 protein of unknown function [Olleya namhaensis]
MKEKITDERFEEILNDLIIEYAKTTTPTIWHQMAMEWNWDSSSVFLNWLTDNPLTDKGTALMIYWKSAPRYWKKFKDKKDLISKEKYSLNDFEFTEKIEGNYLKNFYKQNIFEYNPKSDEQGYDWTNDYLDEKIVRDIPKIMFEKVEGKKVDEPKDFIEGFPPELDLLKQGIFEKYEIE